MLKLNESSWWKLLLGLGLFGVIALYLVRNGDILQYVGRVSATSFAMLLILRLSVLIMSGVFLKVVMRKFGIGLDFGEWFGLSSITTMVNYLGPFSGGIAVQAAYLKRKYSFAYSSFIAVVGASYLVSFLISGIGGILVLWLLFWYVNFFRWDMLLIFLVLTCSMSLLLMPNLRFEVGGRIGRSFTNVFNGWNLIRSDRCILMQLALFALAGIIIETVSFWVAYRALGIKVNFLSIVLIVLLIQISTVLKITPGNFGVRELVAGVSADLLGIGLQEGLLGAIVIRAASIIIVFLCGPLFSIMLGKDM